MGMKLYAVVDSLVVVQELELPVVLSLPVEPDLMVDRIGLPG